MSTADIDTTWAEQAAGMDTVDELAGLWRAGAEVHRLDDRSCSRMPTRLCPPALNSTCQGAGLPCARYEMSTAEAERYWLP